MQVGKKKETNQTERSCKCSPTFCLFLTLRKRSPHSHNESVCRARSWLFQTNYSSYSALRDFFSPASPRARNGSSCKQTHGPSRCISSHLLAYTQPPSRSNTEKGNPIPPPTRPCCCVYKCRNILQVLLASCRDRPSEARVALQITPPFFFFFFAPALSSSHFLKEILKALFK